MIRLGLQLVGLFYRRTFFVRIFYARTFFVAPYWMVKNLDRVKTYQNISTMLSYNDSTKYVFVLLILSCSFWMDKVDRAIEESH